MADLIVRLYDLKPVFKNDIILREHGVRFLRPLTCNKEKALKFISENFSKEWASESETAFSRFPVTMLLAVNKDNEAVGFAVYEATGKSFFGPTGVRKDYRNKGIGRELLLKSLIGLKELGYHYAIIGGVEKSNYEFYKNACGAEEIKGSEQSIYKDIF